MLCVIDHVLLDVNVLSFSQYAQSLQFSGSRSFEVINVAFQVCLFLLHCRTASEKALTLGVYHFGISDMRWLPELHASSESLQYFCFAAFVSLGCHPVIIIIIVRRSFSNSSRHVLTTMTSASVCCVQVHNVLQ